MKDIREELADYAHKAWSGWMKWMLEKSSTSNEEDECTIPRHLAKRWMRQMNTPYADLPEAEKDSDRIEADRILKIVDDERRDLQVRLAELVEAIDQKNKENKDEIHCSCWEYAKYRLEKMIDSMT